MEDMQPGENVQDWLVRFDAEEALRRKDYSHLDGLPRDERERRIKIGRTIEARVAARPSAYERRLAEANAAEEERAARSKPALDVRHGATVDAVDDLKRERSAQRLAIAKILVDERERAQERAAKLERRIAELELRFEQRLAAAETARAEAERGRKAAEAQAARLEKEAAEARAQLRDDFIKLADDLRQRARDMKTAISAELRGETVATIDVKVAAPVERLEVKIAAAEERAEAAGDRTRALETTVAELRGRIGGDDVLRQRLHDDLEAVAAFDARVAALEQRAPSRSDLSVEALRKIATDAVGEAVKAERTERDRVIDSVAAGLRSETAAMANARIVPIENLIEKQYNLSTDEVRRIVDAAASADRERQQDRLSALIGESSDRVRAIIDDKIDVRVAPIEKLIEKQRALSTDDVRRIVDAVIGAECEKQRLIVEATISTEREKQRHDRDQAVAAAVEEVRRADKADIADLERRLRDATGEAPQVRAWSPSTVFYRGQFVTHAGALYQARRDVASTPMSGSDDWLCVTRAGRDGEDGRSIVPRGEYAAGELYAKGDIVSRAGSGWIALRDEPGVLGESEDWMLMAACGPQGKTGPHGDKGEKGDTVRLHSWQIDAPRYRVSGLLEDGTVLPSIELRPLFEQYLLETSG